MTSNRGKTGIRGALSATLMFRPHSDVLYDLTEHGVMGFILFYAIKKQNVADDDVIYALVHH